jgi:protein-disulfide isomerase
MLRRILFLLTLLAPATLAQSTLSPELQQRVIHYVRQYVELSPEAEVTLGAFHAAEIPGYRALPVTIEDQGKTRTSDFLVSDDGKKMLYLSRFDLTRDPYREVMSKIDLRGRPTRGAGPDAPVTVVVFDDFQCPFCARMYVTLFNLVMTEYRNRVHVVYKDFPVSAETHPWSVRAAEDANCLLAQKPEAFWAFADFVHTHLQQMNTHYDEGKAKGAPLAAVDDVTTALGQKLGLDDAKLRACMAAPDRKVIQASLDEGRALGAGATPTSYVNGERLEGAYSAEQLRVLFDRALREAAEKK